MSACCCIHPMPVVLHDGHCCLREATDDPVLALTCEHLPEWVAAYPDSPLAKAEHATTTKENN